MNFIRIRQSMKRKASAALALIMLMSSAIPAYAEPADLPDFSNDQLVSSNVATPSQAGKSAPSHAGNSAPSKSGKSTPSQADKSTPSQAGKIVNEVLPDFNFDRTIELAGDYADGEYTGTGKGFKSTITLLVTIKDNTIVNIEEVSQGDTLANWEKAKALFAIIIDANSTDVDGVSGATKSSNGIKEAVNDALSKAVIKENQVFQDGNGSKSDPFIVQPVHS
uniref:FMN-binding protein n=1 Tax=Clostridium sp. NkU-1 TaxID=1095009 RepID=UPI0006CFCC81